MSWLNQIAEFFSSIFYFFSSIVDFVVSAFQDIVNIIKMLAVVSTHLPDFLVWLPNGIIALLIIIFMVVVIYKVTGREG